MTRLRTGLCALVLAVLTVLPCRVAVASDVHGDDEGDRYVGTGGLLLPSTVGTGVRAQVAGCLDCAWRLSSPCVRPAGNLFSGSGPCLSVVRGCPGGDELLRAWFRRAGEPWREVGLACIGPGGPVTVSALGGLARDRLVRDLPVPRPTAAPRQGVLAQVPVLFGSGQAGAEVHADLDLAGGRVHLDAVPSWAWQFGDESSLSTVLPGGAYPDVSVAHAYEAPGRYRVQLRTIWRATYTVDGLGPFDVPEPVTQTTALEVRVGEGRALLAVR